MARSVRSVVAAVVVATLIPMPGSALQAQVTTYSTFSSWLAAVGAPALDDLNDLTVDTDNPPSTVSRSAGAYSYQLRADNGVFAVADGADVRASTNLATDVLTLDGFSVGVRGVGGLFFGTDIDGALIPTGTLRISWVTAAGNGSLDLVHPGATQFFGLVATGDIQLLSVRDLTQDENLAYWPTVNDIRLAGAKPSIDVPPTTVPEPSTYVLLAAGLAGLGAARRSRRS